jgi:hypothetical protein
MVAEDIILRACVNEKRPAQIPEKHSHVEEEDCPQARKKKR